MCRGSFGPPRARPYHGWHMPGFGDTTFIVLLALLLFGPKKLPVLARQLGKLMADFRRASNEFRTQMEEELRISEQAERQKQIAAIESSAPRAPELIAEPEHPHLPPPMMADGAGLDGAGLEDRAGSEDGAAVTAAVEVVPIASSGGLNLMPPSTGLPVAASAGVGSGADVSAVGLDAAGESQREQHAALNGARRRGTEAAEAAAEGEARPWMI